MRIWSPERDKRNFERDFSRKSYGGNPLFADQKRKAEGRIRFDQPKGDWLKIKKYTLIALISASAIFGGYELIYGRIFKLETLVVTGVSQETENKISTIFKDASLNKQKWLPASNIILFNSTEFKNEINKYFLFEAITVQKKLWHTVVVTAQERPLIATFAGPAGFFAVDSNGLVFRQLRDEETRSLTDLPSELNLVQSQSLNGAMAIDSGTVGVKTTVPLLVRGSSIFTEASESSNPNSMVLGSLVLPQTALNLILEADTALPKITNSRVLRYGVRSTSETVEVFLAAGYKLYLTAATALDIQSKRLDMILKQKLNNKVNQLEYIDLRYDERIFYKLKGVETGPVINDKTSPNN